MRLALFGGSFDPPHVGHYRIIEEALKKLQIDKLIIVPTFKNPWKKRFKAPPQTRFNWIEKVVFDIKSKNLDLKNSKTEIEVSDFEIQNGYPTPTIETVRGLTTWDDEVFLIIGADNLQGIPKWDDFDEIDQRVKWVVATRNDIEIPEKYIKLEVDFDISSTQLRDKVDQEFVPKVIAKDVDAFYSDAKNE
jgi:nicotinate-nucleotide adenylyltransferase